MGEIWGSDNPTPAFRRKIQRRSHDGMCLVKGGRWLFVVSSPGTVMVYDLDAPTTTGKIIIEPQDDLDNQLIRQLTVSIDNQSSVLTFDLALIRDIYGAFMLFNQPFDA